MSEQRVSDEGPAPLDKVLGNTYALISNFGHPEGTVAVPHRDWSVLIVGINDLRAECERLRAETAEVHTNAQAVCDSYVRENQQLYDRAKRAEAECKRLQEENITLRWSRDALGRGEAAALELMAIEKARAERAEAALAKAGEVLRGYEAWEAHVILHGEWNGPLPTLTQEQWDALLVLQAQRNAALSLRDAPENAPGHTDLMISPEAIDAALEGVEIEDAKIGPRPAYNTCKGCPAFVEHYWREPSGDGETYDSGTSQECREAVRNIATYGHPTPPTPDWCPAMARRANAKEQA